MSILSARLAVLQESANQSLLHLTRGLEKESLRVTSEGHLAQTPHPPSLGSALTHSAITTDYSESLLEFITQPVSSVRQLLQELEDIHRYTYENLNGEFLWGASMPCLLGADAEIPVGRYGTSNPGKMKTIYREGLGVRYGRAMQTIAGIHYNFSINDEFWEYWFSREAVAETLQDYKNRRYFDLIRNFRRYFWLLLYFFGASPAVCSSFVKGRSHSLLAFDEGGLSSYLPHATSLRMGDLGYQSNAQSSLVVSYNDLDSYVQTLCSAITQPHEDYVRKGLRDANGDYQQLNTSLLQIENEFYSTIRPKRASESGETALNALFERGVDYVEVRCVDINPYEPLGITAEQIHFMDVFLVYCLLSESPKTDADKYFRALENQRRVVNYGRDPEVRLLSAVGEQSLFQWGNALLDEMSCVACALDASHNTRDFSSALKAQKEKLSHPELTPSARILADMRSTNETFFEFALHQSLAHSRHFHGCPLPRDRFEAMAKSAEESLQKQRDLEASPQVDFEDYLDNYYGQYMCCQ